MPVTLTPATESMAGLVSASDTDVVSCVAAMTPLELSDVLRADGAAQVLARILTALAAELAA